jgi:transposase
VVARRTREYRERVVQRFERSGLTQAAFCKREHLSRGTFQNWLYKVRHSEREEGKPRQEPEPAFVELKTTAATTSDACRLKLPGAELTFAELPTPQYVFELLRHVERDPR